MKFKDIKTFEDACRERSVDPNALPDVSMLPERHRKSMVAYFKLCIIVEAINDGWEPDYSNTDQFKYFPYFAVEADTDRPSGFGFSDANYVSWGARTAVGSRLCFSTREMALYAAEQFKDLYIDYLLMS
jgi:hypothetical protein